MFKKKRNLIFASCLVGLLATTTATTLALSSCKANSSPSKPDNPTNPDTPSKPDTPAKPDETPYSGVIDWNDKNLVNNLITDDSGLVYSDNTKTIVIAVKPEVKSATIKIPSKVKSIMGYTRVMYKTSDGVIHENIPTGGVTYSKVNQLYGAFENVKTLTSITLESGSQLENIGKLAFLNCTALTSIQGTTTSNLKYIGVNSFSNCNNLQTIDTSNVTRIDDSAFSNCTSLSKIDLSNTLAIGNGTFYNCTNLETLGSLAKLKTIDKEAFYNATKSGATIALKLSSLISVADSAFSGAKGISTVDFSNNTALTTIVDNAFINSSITSVDFSGCTKLTSINQRAFENCVNLTAVSLPDNNSSSLTSIGWNTFAKCTKLTSIAPKGSTGFIATNKLSSLGTNALANTAITSVDLSNFAISSTNSSSAPLGSETSLAFIPNLTSVKLPNSITTLNAGLFYGSGTSGAGFSLDLPSSITNIIYSTSVSISNPNGDDTSAKISVENATPFTNSGVTSVDMSKITSYQTSTNSADSIPSYLFNGVTKLISVVLKNSTSAIGNNAFQGTTSLTSITYPNSSNTIADSNSTAGFKASSNLSTIGTDAFKNAFSANSNAAVDLSATKMVTAPASFDSSNVTSVVLPSTVTTIPANSFDNMSKLTSFNFGDLTNLKQITAPNFNNTQLKSIDLSNVENPSNLFNNQDTNNKLFTSLPSNCVVSLPNASWDFKGAFVDKSSNLVLLSYPKGIPFGNVSNKDGIFGFSNGNDEKIKNIKDINISNNEAIMSIGPNTFFGSSNLNSVTLNAKGISGGNATQDKIGLFSSSTTNITSNTLNTTQPSQYTKDVLPFGNNANLTSINYVGFTLDNNATNGKTDIETLFKKTSQITWAEISKIISSLSYQSTEYAGDAASVTPNMTNWVATNGGNKTMNTDIQNYWDNRENINNMVLTNLYNSASDPTGNAKSFNGETTQMTFMHNGATWTYTNDGQSIKLTGTVNMYKLTNGTDNNYLTYFNQLTYVSTGSNTYYIPGDSITVTLTVATK